MAISGVVRSGHSVGDADGIILAVDANVCELLGRPARELIGMSYLQITHPDDRAANIRQLAALPAGDAPITISKRYLRGDGSFVPVDVSVSRLSTVGERGNRLVGTVRWRDGAAPDRLWKTARKVEMLANMRKRMLGLDRFPDYPMSILLRTYIAEMEGRAITIGELAHQLEFSLEIAKRWVRVLIGQGLIDPWTGTEAPLQLSDSGIARLEHLLRAAG